MKQRLDKILVDRKLAETRSKAQRIIEEFGVKVDSQVIYDVSKMVAEDAKIEILEPYKYVSSGGYKLEGLLKTGIIDVKNKVCFDIGSSAGGFVDCLLKFGAKKVYCCDVGKGLLHPKLRSDERVVLFEGVNFRYFVELGCKEKIKDKIDIFTIDVSFISLTKILPVVKKIAEYPHNVVALVKPQFECEPKYVKKGIVKEEKYRLQAVEKIVSFAESLGYKKITVEESKVKGKEGNIEYFVVFSFSSNNQM
jgi:23S rRNA (cytidine1920-2'-O)/16S rRNA (cytidine1409-2'-O)-methyltransferase